MKSLFFILSFFLLFVVSVNAFSQGKEGENAPTVLSFGLAFGDELNIGHWGLFICNDLKVGLNRYLALNPRINYFETVAAVESGPWKGFSSHSGIFTDLGLSFSFVRQSDYAFSLNAGPSFQLGNETRRKSSSILGDQLIDETFEHSRIRRFGFYTDLEYNWNREGKYLHTVALKTYSFDIYPEFLGLGYKIGFKL